MDPVSARQLLKQTYLDYNRIAPWFSKTRAFAWPELEAIKNLINNGDQVLDLGCGNGRLLDLLKEEKVQYIGIDVSEKLINLAREKHPEEMFKVADALDLPFEDNSFDKIICLAVWHHVPSFQLRIEFLNQAKRVLKPDGLLILSVWNLWQRRFLKYHWQYFLLKISGRSRLDFKDIFYPFKNQKGEILAQRYLHAFRPRELKYLVRKTGLRIEKISFWGENKRNLYLLARKSP